MPRERNVTEVIQATSDPYLNDTPSTDSALERGFNQTNKKKQWNYRILMGP